jgi:2-polyprenyl-6-hydroxyphenyl methylase/3-demethylubiquinone-9 3-methyltransferase
MPIAAPSISEKDVAGFSALAKEWWNPDGQFRFLHKMGPVRQAYIAAQVASRFKRDPAAAMPYAGLTFLDVGCGGGLLAESLAKAGAKVMAIDASADSIEVARLHAKESGVSIDYRAESAEALASAGATYDVVTSLEVVEHVAHLPSFLKAVSQLVKPGGLLILSSLNRTPLSFVLGIVVAEYMTGWVPVGTHDWKKFRKPSELAAILEGEELSVRDVTGVVYDIRKKLFSLQKGKTAMDYMMTATKPVPNG